MFQYDRHMVHDAQSLNPFLQVDRVCVLALLGVGSFLLLLF